MPVIKPQTKPLSRVELLLHACLSRGVILQIMKKSGSYVTPLPLTTVVENPRGWDGEEGPST